MYLQKTQGIALPVNVANKADSVLLMESVWRHVTPGMGGVHKLEQLYNGVLSYAKEYGFDVDHFALPVPKKEIQRPALSSVIQFIAEGLRNDCPIAFLNLSNGKVENLDEWHWVTIVSLNVSENLDVVEATIYDGTKPMTINLKLWYETTRLGGGFIYFVKQEKNRLADTAV